MDELSFPAKQGAKPFYVAGVDDRSTDDRIVAIAVQIRTELKIGDRDFSAGSLCLHEIAVMRSFYEARGGGSIRPQPGWLPNLDRFPKLTSEKLKQEAERLRKTAMVPRAGMPPIMCFDALYGTTPNEQLTRLHTVMKEQYEAWNKLMEVCRGRLKATPAGAKITDPAVFEAMAADLMTEREIDEIINLANPAMRGLSEIELGEIKPKAPVTVPDAGPLNTSTDGAAEGEEDEVDKRLSRLRAAGVEERAANELASLLELVGDSGKVADEDIAKIAGTKEKATVSKIRKALLG